MINIENKLIELGFILKGTIKHNRFVNCAHVSRPNKADSVWYCYDEGKPFVSYGSWNGCIENGHFFIEEAKPFTAEEKQAYAKKKAEYEEHNRKLEAERLNKLALKRDFSLSEYSKFSKCTGHDYLERKKIYSPELYDFKIDDRGNLLCVPFHNIYGEMQGYQTINESGDKRFCGSVGGYFWQYPKANPCPEVFNRSNMFYIIGEGIATCLSAYEAIINCYGSRMFLPVILCAFNAGNMDKVITATKASKLPYLLLVDNDSTKARNTGIETAKTLLTTHDDCEINPITFKNGDANDFILEHGEVEFIKLLNQYASRIINRIL